MENIQVAKEIVDFQLNMVIFHSYVKLPEGKFWRGRLQKLEYFQDLVQRYFEVMVCLAVACIWLWYFGLETCKYHLV